LTGLAGKTWPPYNVAIASSPPLTSAVAIQRAAIKLAEIRLIAIPSDSYTASFEDFGLTNVTKSVEEERIVCAKAVAPAQRSLGSQRKSHGKSDLASNSKMRFTAR
jgi:hypothetical protein